MKKKLLPIIMILILLMTAPVQALAAKPDMPDMETGLKYLNIGDSIAFGLSAAPGESYFERYADYLENNYSFTDSVNLGLPGLDSEELLMALRGEFDQPDPHYMLQLRLHLLIPQADVITISIGGNNLLTPVIGTVAGLYGINASSEDFMTNLYGEIEKFGKDGLFGWDSRLEQFTESALSGPLGEVLEYRSDQFLSDWPAILTEIENLTKELNPDAHIIAMTIYNPIEKEDNKDLYHRYEKLVRPMNIAIMKTQNRAMVAKVEKAFAKEPEAVDFRLTWMEGLLPVWLDPHPTTLGHGIIFEELINQRNPRSIY